MLLIAALFAAGAYMALCAVLIYGLIRSASDQSKK